MSLDLLEVEKPRKQVFSTSITHASSILSCIFPAGLAAATAPFCLSTP
jgi:hypothetical protein